jgi:hypothetical protein
MTDIIDRLRQRRMLASDGPVGTGRRYARMTWVTDEPDADCSEAAEEIERLRADVEQYTGLWRQSLDMYSRKNRSGCACKIDEDTDELLSACELHIAWRDAYKQNT